MLKFTSRVSTRLLSTKPPIPLVISEEVQQALAENKPVISLESTILTHGFPYPENLSLGTEFEATVRENGGIPATIAFMRGVPHVGLSSSQLQELTENSNIASKVSRRDIGHVMANKMYGATTIASTSILSAMAGISVFGTGGLGGVHREGQYTMDISNDLIELGRNPITVVCAGPKSILDIGLTMEYLETQGVYVTTYNDFGEDPKSIEIPGFYARKSGVKSPNTFNNFAEVAQVIHQQKLMGLDSGNLVCIPPPKEYALDSELIGNIIQEANEEAKSLGIKGKDVTPFLLLKIGEMTKGKSLESNKKFVMNNIQAATKIATELSSPGNSQVQPVITGKRTEDISKPPIGPVDSVVVGSVAMDTISRLEPGYHLHDSNPADTKSSIGGVGHNVALASYYSGGDTVLVLVVGSDNTGSAIVNELLMKNAIEIRDSSTASYTSIHSPDGELLVACSDMKIIQEDFSNHINSQVEQLSPKTLVVDCNLSAKTINKVLESIKDKNITSIIEPTSLIKSRTIAELRYPVDLITPTISELNAIYERMELLDKFDDEWFEVIDSLKLDEIHRFPLKSKIAELVKEGHLQKCFRLLPFAHNIVLKLGAEGVLSVGQTRKNIFSSKTNQIRTNNFYVDYYPIPEANKTLSIVNVTGAGDTMLGYLLSNYKKLQKDELFKNCQLASGLTLVYDGAINPAIGSIE